MSKNKNPETVDINVFTEKAQYALAKAMRGEELDKGERQSLQYALTRPDKDPLPTETAAYIQSILDGQDVKNVIPVGIEIDEDGLNNFGGNVVTGFFDQLNMNLVEDCLSMYGEAAIEALCGHLHDIATNAICGAFTLIFPENSAPRKFLTSKLGGTAIYTVVSGLLNIALMALYRHTGSQFKALRLTAGGGARNTFGEIIGLFDIGALLSKKLPPIFGVLLNFRENGTPPSQQKK